MSAAVQVRKADAPNVAKSLDDWGELIRGDVERGVQAFMSAGLNLMKAREQHPKDFVRWLDTGAAGMKRSFAYQLMKVVAHPDVPAMLEILPKDTTALYELSRLPAGRLQEAVEAGAVSQTSSRSEVKTFVFGELERTKRAARIDAAEDAWCMKLASYPEDVFERAIELARAGDTVELTRGRLLFFLDGGVEEAEADPAPRVYRSQQIDPAVLDELNSLIDTLIESFETAGET